MGDKVEHGSASKWGRGLGDKGHLYSSSVGPILFNLFINGMVSDTECTLIKFEIKCIIISGDTKLRTGRDQMVMLSKRPQ